MLNKNYGKLSSTNSIQYAPRTFRENDQLFIPRIDDDEAYFARGWLKIVDTKPQYDAESQIIHIKQWIANEEAKTLTAEYVIEPRPEDKRKKVKKYSKLRITLFCIEMGIWNSVKEYLEKIGYYDLFVMATFFLETDEYFTKGLQMYMEAMVANGSSKDDIESLIENMKNFAYDGDVIVNEEGRAIGLY